MITSLSMFVERLRWQRIGLNVLEKVDGRIYFPHSHVDKSMGGSHLKHIFQQMIQFSCILNVHGYRYGYGNRDACS